MPSYALNPYIDLDEVLCKQLLSLDLREPTRMSALPVSPVSHKKTRPGSFSSLNDHKGSAGTIGQWGQTSEAMLPSSWNKMSFLAERSVSMVEATTSSLGWASADSCTCKPAPASSCTSIPSALTSIGTSSTTSSRYKTELCRTYTERGMCKYGSKCQFAHGPEELRDLSRHPKYKTEPCRTFHSVGFCPYGIRCHFVHNNEDDHAHARPKLPASSSSSSTPTGRTLSQRPPLLKHSFSFAGFPSNPPPPVMDSTLQHAFLRAPSVSPPASTDLSDLLSLAFSEVDVSLAAAAATLEAGRDSQPQFLPSPDSGCSTCSLTSTGAHLSPQHSLVEPAERGLQRSPTGGPATVPTAITVPGGCPIASVGVAAMGVRSLSYTSLSDHEGGCGSSASSQSGSDSCASGFEGAGGRRLPIFSQLSVPDDGFCSEGGSQSFFL